MTVILIKLIDAVITVPRVSQIDLDEKWVKLYRHGTLFFIHERDLLKVMKVE